MHVLSFLGTGSYKTTIYEFPEPVKTQYFIEALTANLDPPPTKITVFVTRESEVMHFPLVLEKLRTNGFKDSQVQKIKIPAGQTVDELWEIFNQVISAVDVGEEIVFDITHSLRFLPVITFLTLIYLRSVKDIKINELYYGAYTQERLDNTPVFRLSGFLDIFDWLEGADSFIKYGDAGVLGKKLVEIQGKIRQTEEGEPSELKTLGGFLDSVSKGLRYWRPQMIPQQINQFSKNYGVNGEKRILLSKELEVWAKPYTLLTDKVFASYCSLGQNHSIDFYINLAEWYLKNGNPIAVVSLLRETFVSKCILFDDSETGNNEFVPAKRYQKEKMLNYFCESMPEHIISKIWIQIRNLRNDFAHFGFRANCTNPAKLVKDIHELFQQAKKILLTDEYWAEINSIFSSSTKILVTPLGMSRGLLYSALKLVQPEQVIVVTSNMGVGRICDITRAANYSGKVTTIIVEDPFCCFHDVKVKEVLALIEIAQPYRIIVNITGGTTALQYAAESFFMNYKGFKQLVAIIDRRSLDDQKSDPYHCGELQIISED